MIHAWLYARGQNPGHGHAFKKKMRELGMRSIFHDLGSLLPKRESARRFILRCDKCALELLRKRRPPGNVLMRPLQPAALRLPLSRCASSRSRRCARWRSARAARGREPKASGSARIPGSVARDQPRRGAQDHPG